MILVSIFFEKRIEEEFFCFLSKKKAIIDSDSIGFYPKSLMNTTTGTTIDIHLIQQENNVYFSNLKKKAYYMVCITLIFLLVISFLKKTTIKTYSVDFLQ